MAWYSTGTVSVSNGSKIVNGNGTAWFGALQAGWGFVSPDGRAYEIEAVNSATQITLKKAFTGSTASGQEYAAFPTMSLAHDLVERLNALIAGFQNVKDEAGAGKFAKGTAAAPGVRGLTDQDTGLVWNDNNTLGQSVGGTIKALLSSAAYKIDVPITGTAVQSSATDSTEGRLLTPGAFGWGRLNQNEPPLTNLADRTIPTGVYTFIPSTLGLPADLPSLHGVVVVEGSPVGGNHAGLTRIVQRVIHTDTGQVWTRGATNTTPFSRWQKHYSTANILGTVSQSGSVPTGAVIERGSNANGAYVRFADGTQICWKRVTLTGQSVSDSYGSLFKSGSLLSGNSAYPATFAVAPACVITAHIDNYACITAVGGTGDVNNVPAIINAVAGVSLSDRTIRVEVVAKGIWF